jgi:hypothetical protein
MGPESSDLPWGWMGQPEVRQAQGTGIILIFWQFFLPGGLARTSLCKSMIIPPSQLKKALGSFQGQVSRH